MVRHISWLALALVATLLLASTFAGASQKTSRKEAALRFIAERGDEPYNSELLQLVAYPSVSALPDNHGDLLAAAGWLQRRLADAGLENARILPTQGLLPVVYAEYLHAPPGAPTALVYGHYDVQPAMDTLPLWASHPFKPEIRGGRFWGRGASDDKGSGVLPPVQALEAILKSGAGGGGGPPQLPINIKVMLEGEEEVGSPHLDPFLAQHADLLACDYVLSADGGQISETQPSLSLGLRGALGLEVELVTAATDVHSGLAGGAVQNPGRALAQLLASMWHAGNHSVAIKGFYDNVRPITQEDRDDILAYNYDEQKELLTPLGASEAVGEAGYTTLERLWHRPTLEVVGMGAGFQGEGIKTIVPRRAFAKLAARLVPDQTPAEIEALIEAHVADHLPPACNASIQLLGFKAHPYTQPKESLPNRVAAKVLTHLMGNPPKFVRSGATIPALAAFQTHLNVSTTVFAFGLPDSNMHAPNENHPLSMYRLARRAWVELLFELGDAAAAAAAAPPADGQPQRNEL
ncbi:peptidase M20 [Micractinium conductrix]|uniref:Peptidase M20 n=1 Tax=Micractinium conductrix TaxID=554055 RepID=A0A2P6V1N9_9CHLO|nr:peptidase M20 [Micractinium conductrix]|eukprot:PSC68017.1 peptidase M20 [Micractinium conductrix]